MHCDWPNTTSILTIIASFSFQVSFISSSREGNRVAWQTQWIYPYVFAVNKPRLRLFLTGCTRRCDVTLFPSHTHTHTHTHTNTRYTQNSPFEQSISNTWTNDKTYLELLKRQIVGAKLEFTFFFFFFLNSLRAKPALNSTRFKKLLSIKCVVHIWTFWLYCSAVNKS